MVVFTTIITPILLKPDFKIGPNQPHPEAAFSNAYEELDRLRDEGNPESSEETSDQSDK